MIRPALTDREHKERKRRREGAQRREDRKEDALMRHDGSATHVRVKCLLSTPECWGRSRELANSNY